MTINVAQHSWKHLDDRELQARLNALPGNQGNSYAAEEWVFRDRNQNAQTISFTSARTVIGKYPEWVQAQGIDPESLTKKLFLSFAERTGITNYTKTFRGLLLWIAAMANQNVATLSRETLPQVLRFRLTHSFSARGIYRTRDPISYSMLITPSLSKFHEVCEDFGLQWFGRDMNDHSLQIALKKLVPTLTDQELTYRDWKEGKSFNLLTLDYGRYYVEHCLNVFEEHAPLALALRQTQLNTPQLAKSLNVKRSSIDQNMSRILEGHTAKDINRESPNHVRRIQRVILEHFRSIYHRTRFEHDLLQEQTLREVARTFALAQSPENIDRLRVVIWDWLRHGFHEKTEQLLRQCHTPVSQPLFEQTLESIRRRSADTPLSLPTPDLFSELGFEQNQNGGIGIISRFIAWVAKAGLTGVVALTGWRKSEFGFPWSAIQKIRNTDKLDEYAFPHRYQVDWYVHKTNGQVRTLREISFSTVTIIDRVRRLNCSGDEQPSLYTVRDNKKDSFKSTNAVEKAVTHLWPHFVHHYPGFRFLDNQTAWQRLEDAEASQGLLTINQHIERDRLLALHSAEEWEATTVDENLLSAWKRARTEWPRLSFIWFKNLKSRRTWAVRYRQGTLHQKWTDLLDSYLSDETREWLFSLSIEEVANNKEVGRVVSNEILADALYPSPHAFRHMWAESVYRRFDGDAGWIIRSQFKHISQCMWLAYIRDKDNRLNHQRAKLSVTHSLVANFLNHKGEGYTGQMAILLRRLSQKTRVLSPDEQKELATKLATQEIENLKSSPWGYCLLMRRSRHQAKCAQGGDPMRHNASPELCLGCIHNLMQTSNVEWMTFHISAHVDALHNPVVPDIFKRSSYDLVRKTARHIRKLDPEHEALPEIETALTHYRRAC